MKTSVEGRYDFAKQSPAMLAHTESGVSNCGRSSQTALLCLISMSSMKSFSWLFALLLPITVLSQDAPMFRGNLAHTGVYNAAGVPKFNSIKWKFQTGGRVVSSPAVVAGVAYVGSTDGSLYAIDASTGTLKWKFATKGWVSSSPAVSSGVVYFESYDSNFYAVDAATGQFKWKFQTAGEKHYSGTHLHGLQPQAEAMPDPWDFYLSSPSVWNGAVYFGSGDGNVYALAGC
jgi:hypothetical protein